MNKSASSLRLRSAATALLASLTLAPQAFAGAFLHTTAGPYEYSDTTNWSGTLIGNNWTSNLTADQTITFTNDYTIADQDGAGSGSTSSLSITNNSTFNHTFISGGTDRTLTLGGNITLGSNATNANKVTIGSNTAGQRLNVDLGGATRNFTTGTNRTLEIVNVLSGTGGIAAQGVGTLRLINTNTFTSGFSFGGSGIASSVVEVTKLANGGEDSSIGRSNNSQTNLIFGGSNTGTLRYIGAGDSTDRRFSAGGVGAIFDASGSGALKWTNTANVTWSGTGNTVRALTFTGTNTQDNTMAAGIVNNGTAATSIKKEGIGRWIFTGTNTYTGDTTIDAGTLATGATGSFGSSNIIVAAGAFLTAGNATSFGDTATLTFSRTSTAASISLSSGTDTIGAVYDSISATYMTAGTHDAAALNSFFGTSVFTGLGSLTISAIPEPSAFALLAGGVGLLLASFRRQRRAV